MATAMTAADAFAALRRAFEANDADAAVGAYADDAVVVGYSERNRPGSAQRLEGRAGIEPWIRDVISRNLTHAFSDEVIGEDYLLTNRFYRRDTSAASDLPDEVRQAIGSVEASFLAAAYEAIRAEYGDLDNYLREGLALGTSERAALKARYLQP